MCEYFGKEGHEFLLDLCGMRTETVTEWLRGGHEFFTIIYEKSSKGGQVCTL